MHTLLQQLFEKKSIDIKDLTPEEKQTYDTWEATLSGEKLTVEKIEEFCQIQKDKIELLLGNFDNTPQKNERLIMLLTMYNTFLKMIRSTVNERHLLEKHLNELIDKA